jgi:hypothetical protein
MSAPFRRAAIGWLLLAVVTAAAPAARASEDGGDEESRASEPAPPAEATPPAGIAERQALLRAKLATALGQLAPIKLMMTEHFLTVGAWPASPGDVGLEPQELTSSVIAGVAFESDGTIVARLSPDFGKDRVLRLAPKPVMGGTSLEWQCRANLPPAVLRMLSCEATP